MKICITGGLGYIGSHTAKALIRAGHTVIVIDRRNVKQNIIKNVRYYISDYADTRMLDLLEDEGIDGIVHCAGTSLVGPSVSEPSEYYNNNVVKTIQLLDHIKNWNNIPFIVFSSSAAVYGNPSVMPIKEDFLLNPVNPYGHTKLMIESILKDYNKAYNIRYFIYRYFNAAGADVWDSQLGPEPNDTHIIPKVFEAYTNKQPFTLYGTDYNTVDGTCIRDYIHVCDIANAHLKACKELSKNSPEKTYNLGTNFGRSNRDIIRVFGELVSEISVFEEKRREGDPDILVADGSKYRHEQGEPLQYSSLETIIKSLRDYYEKHNRL